MASHANFDTKGPVVLPRYSVCVPVEAPTYVQGVQYLQTKKRQGIQLTATVTLQYSITCVFKAKLCNTIHTIYVHYMNTPDGEVCSRPVIVQ